MRIFVAGVDKSPNDFNRNTIMMSIHPLFLGKIGLTEILVILAIIIIFFGGRKIPELMRGMGRGIREFKDAMEHPDAPAKDDGKPAEKADSEPKK